MPFTNFPYGVSTIGGTPVLPNVVPGFSSGFGGTGNNTNPGLSNVYFVNSTVATASDASDHGSSPQTPFKTINFALSRTLANNGDVIYAGPGHVETISAAAGWANAAASLTADGVTIYFQGGEADRAQVTFTTSTAAQLVIGASNMTLVGARFVTGIDAVAAAISVTGPGTKFYNCEFVDAASKNTLIQILTAATASNLIISGWRHIPASGGTQITEVIRLIGVNDCIIENMVAMADYTTAAINNITTLCLRMLIRDCYLANLHAASTLAIAVLTTTTGFVTRCALQSVSGTPWITTSNKFSVDLASAGSQPGGTATALV